MKQKYLESDYLQTKMQMTIIELLDFKNPQFKHNYKQFSKHSKNSDVNEVQNIVFQLIEKHYNQGPLCHSQQYILSGYLLKYMNFAQKYSSARKMFLGKSSALQNSGTKYSFKNRQEQKKKKQLYDQLQKVKFLWEIYKTKSITCRNILKIKQSDNNQRSKQLSSIMTKLLSIQKQCQNNLSIMNINEIQKSVKSLSNTLSKMISS